MRGYSEKLSENNRFQSEQNAAEAGSRSVCTGTGSGDDVPGNVLGIRRIFVGNDAEKRI